MRGGSLETELGWHLHPRKDPNPRSIANFPIQANAAEILRVACCLVTEAGFEVCAPVHDALLVNCRIEDIDRTVAEVKAMMIKASQIVLGGFAHQGWHRDHEIPEPPHRQARHQNVGRGHGANGTAEAGEWPRHEEECRGQIRSISKTLSSSRTQRRAQRRPEVLAKDCPAAARVLHSDNGGPGGWVV